MDAATHADERPAGGGDQVRRAFDGMRVWGRLADVGPLRHGRQAWAANLGVLDVERNLENHRARAATDRGLIGPRQEIQRRVRPIDRV